MTRMISRSLAVLAAGLLLATSMAISAVAAAPESTPVLPHEGAPAPDIDLPTTQVGLALPHHASDRTLHLKDLEGKKTVVLYFFPKAMTRG